jgi:hypothetical protein
MTPGLLKIDAAGENVGPSILGGWLGYSRGRRDLFLALREGTRFCRGGRSWIALGSNFERFERAGTCPCERLKNAVFAYLKNGAMRPTRWLPVGLSRLERGEHDLTVNKLIALANIHGMPPEQLLRRVEPDHGCRIRSSIVLVVGRQVPLLRGMGVRTIGGRSITLGRVVN